MKVILGEKEATIRIRDKDRIIERIVHTNILSEESKSKIAEITQAMEVNQDVESYHCTICNRRHYRNRDENHNSAFFKHFFYATDKKGKRDNNSGYKTSESYFCQVCQHKHFKGKGKKENSVYEKHYPWREK